MSKYRLLLCALGALAVVAPLSASTITEAWKQKSKCDSDGIFDAFDDIAAAFNSEPVPNEVIFDNMDKNGSGFVTFKELKKYLAKNTDIDFDKPCLKEAFQSIDEDGNGAWDFSEIESFLGGP